MESPSYWPTHRESEEWAKTVNMDEEIESLASFYKDDVEVGKVSSLENGTFTPNMLHNIAELAEELNLPLRVQYSSIVVSRPKSRKELEEQVIARWRSKQYELRQKAAEQPAADNG